MLSTVCSISVVLRFVEMVSDMIAVSLFRTLDTQSAGSTKLSRKTATCMSGVGNLCPVSLSRTEYEWFGILCLDMEAGWRWIGEVESSLARKFAQVALVTTPTLPRRLRGNDPGTRKMSRTIPFTSRLFGASLSALPSLDMSSW
jgi:hypothetical protein